jgi:hypothetical protein
VNAASVEVSDMYNLNELVYEVDLKIQVPLSSIADCIKFGCDRKSIEHLIRELSKDVDNVDRVIRSPDCVTTGLCRHIHIDGVLKDALFSGWSKHTGEVDYPVPDPDGDYTPGEKYHSCWDMFEGEYGDLRIDLGHYFIERANELRESLEEYLNGK